MENIKEGPFFKHMMLEMHTLWRQEKLCDIQLRVQGMTIAAHRIVLAALSPYFRAMFCSHLGESQQSEVEIKGLTSSVVFMIVEYSYTSVLHLTEDNVQMVLHAVSMLQIPSLELKCTRFLTERLHPSNCLGIRDFAHTMGCFVLHSVADNYCQDNFLEVSQNEEFLHLRSAQVIDLVARDALKVQKEEDVYMAVMRWLEYDPEGRADCMVKIMEKVRLPLVQWNFLMGKVSKHKLFTHNEECRQYLQQARAFQVSSFHPDLNNFAFNEAVLRAQPRIGFGTIEHLYVIGGETSNREILPSVERYNPITYKIKQLSDLSSPRRSLAVVIFNKKIYAIGGSDGVRALATVEVYSIEENTWHTATSLQEPRTSVSAVVVDEQIFVLGGHNGFTALSSVEVYDTDTNTWTFSSELLTLRSMMATVTLDGCIFVLGGYDGNTDLSSAEMINTKSSQWIEIASMHEPRSMMNAAVLDKRIFVVGGSCGAQCLSSVEVYDPSTNMWTVIQSLNVARRGLGVAVIGGAIFAAGGHDGKDFLNTVEKYNKYKQEWTIVGCLNNYRSRFGFV